MTTRKSIPVVVTTLHRGVFFGYAKQFDGPIVTIERARNCLYWPTEQKGFAGLATTGPVNGAKVGPTVTVMHLRDVTAVLECSEEAAKAWDGAKWK